MNDAKLYAMPMEELAARALVAGRALANDVPVNLVAADALQHRQIRSLLDAIAGDNPTCQRARQSVDLLVSILASERETETLGYRNVFEGENDPEYGAIGEVYQERVLSERGEAIAVWWTKLLALGQMMQILDARLCAERAVNRRCAV